MILALGVVRSGPGRSAEGGVWRVEEVTGRRQVRPFVRTSAVPSFFLDRGSAAVGLYFPQFAKRKAELAEWSPS